VYGARHDRRAHRRSATIRCRRTGFLGNAARASGGELGVPATILDGIANVPQEQGNAGRAVEGAVVIGEAQDGSCG